MGNVMKVVVLFVIDGSIDVGVYLYDVFELKLFDRFFLEKMEKIEVLVVIDFVILFSDDRDLEGN